MVFVSAPPPVKTSTSDSIVVQTSDSEEYLEEGSEESLFPGLNEARSEIFTSDVPEVNCTASLAEIDPVGERFKEMETLTLQRKHLPEVIENSLIESVRAQMIPFGLEGSPHSASRKVALPYYPHNRPTLGTEKLHANIIPVVDVGTVIDVDTINSGVIVCQCPTTEAAKKEFWELALNSLNLIINLHGRGEVLWDPCNYFPLAKGGEMIFDSGEIVVECTQMGVCLDEGVVSRTIKIVKGEEEKNVRHLHFYDWPDMGVPTDEKAVKMINTIIPLIPGETYAEKWQSMNQLLVHCLAGVGRSGTLITLLLFILEQGEKSSAISLEEGLQRIENIVMRGRVLRSSMFVSVDQQLRLIFRVLTKLGYVND